MDLAGTGNRLDFEDRLWRVMMGKESIRREGKGQSERVQRELIGIGGHLDDNVETSWHL